MLEPARDCRDSGESKAHAALIACITGHPELLGLPRTVGIGAEEYRVPSGDSINVLFSYRGEYIGVEVKPSFSDHADLTHGLFQCVKYLAVLEAMQAAMGIEMKSRVHLALAGSLPDVLVPLKNILGVEALEEVGAQQ